MRNAVKNVSSFSLNFLLLCQSTLVDDNTRLETGSYCQYAFIIPCRQVDIWHWEGCQSGNVPSAFFLCFALWCLSWYFLSFFYYNLYETLCCRRNFGRWFAALQEKTLSDALLTPFSTVLLCMVRFFVLVSFFCNTFTFRLSWSKITTSCAAAWFLVWRKLHNEESFFVLSRINRCFDDRALHRIEVTILCHQDTSFAHRSLFVQIENISGLLLLNDNMTLTRSYSKENETISAWWNLIFGNGSRSENDLFSVHSEKY